MGGLSRHRAGLDGRPQGVEQRLDGGLDMERNLVAGHLDGHPAGHQSAAEPRNGTHPGPDEDGHLRPGHAILEMGPAQQVCDVVRLGAAGGEREDVDPTLAVRGVHALGAAGKPRRSHGRWTP